MLRTVIYGCVLLVAATFVLDAQETASSQTATADDQAAKPKQATTTPAASPSAQDLANQVNNPAAPVTFIQFRNILAPAVPGTNGVTNGLQVQPVLPIGPFKAFPFVQLVKVTMPVYLSVPGTVDLQSYGVTGAGDLQLFDLVSIKQSWGRWGIGPALVFPTASARVLGSGKYQAGPAVAAIYTGVKNLTVGAVVQNPISYAGDATRPRVNNMLITPTLTYNLKDGWFAGLSDYNWSFNWEDHGATTLPLGVQVGKVVTIGRQPVSLSVEAGGTAVRPAGTPNPGWILGFELSPIFNFHVGAHDETKVKVRKQK